MREAATEWRTKVIGQAKQKREKSCYISEHESDRPESDGTRHNKKEKSIKKISRWSRHRKNKRGPSIISVLLLMYLLKIPLLGVVVLKCLLLVFDLIQYLSLVRLMLLIVISN